MANNLAFNFQQESVAHMNEMELQTVVMTPAFAKVLLSNNKGNRNLRKGHIESLKNRILRGEWKLSPQGIVVHKTSGKLLDGQHRLSAIIEAGVPVPVVIIYTDDEGVFRVLDQGAKRSMGDIFNTDSRVSDTVNFCCRLMLNSFGSLSPGQVEPVLNSSVGQISQELIDFCGTSRRGFSSSPVKAAVVSSVIFGSDKDYVFNLYRDLIMYDLDRLPPVGKAFLRQLNTGSIDFSKSNGSKNTYARSLKLFDESNKDMNVIRFNDVGVSQMISRSAKKMKDVLIREGSLSSDWGRDT